MMDDLVEKLYASDEANALTNEAAREIERLRAALERIGNADQRIEDRNLWIFQAQKIAREALSCMGDG